MPEYQKRKKKKQKRKTEKQERENEPHSNKTLFVVGSECG